MDTADVAFPPTSHLEGHSQKVYHFQAGTENVDGCVKVVAFCRDTPFRLEAVGWTKSDASTLQDEADWCQKCLGRMPKLTTLALRRAIAESVASL